MWYEPLSIFHFMVWVVIGFGNAVSLLLQFRPKYFRWSQVGCLIVIVAASVMSGREPSWRRVLEGLSIVLICACILGIGWLLLDKLLPASKNDVEQFVGRERRERVS